MRRSNRITWCFVTLAAVVSVGTVAAQQAARVDDKALRNAAKSGEEWLATGRDYGETRYSPLNQINAGNVGRLGLAWYFDTDSEPGRLEATPTVSNGILYATLTWSVVFAVDARTGKEIWRYDPHIGHHNFPLGPDKQPDSSQPRTGPTICCGPGNRGVALYDGKVYAGLLDGRLVALDAETGKVVWQVQTTDPNADYSITGAPRILKDKVIIGNGGSDYDVRGYVTAYDAETGRQLWRFYTVPGDPSKPFENKAMERAAKTWKGDQWYKMGGGGSNWDVFSYDPDLDLVYFGTGNGGPYPQKYRSPGDGDNLYIASIMALRASTGEYVWHYQTTPGDEWDYDAVQDLILADLKINGKMRKVIMQANKNGFFYVLDRKTGKFLSAALIDDKVTWTTGMDQKTGRPIVAPGARYDDADDGAWVFPGATGVHNTPAMSFNPNTGLAYVPGGGAYEWYAVDPNFKYRVGVVSHGQLRNLVIYGQANRAPQPGPKKPPPAEVATRTNFLVAWDPVTQKERWRVQQMNGGGTVTTAGNLVFACSNDGRFVAFSADKGEKLWEVKLVPGFSNPSTYMLDGKQYVSVLAGSAGRGRLYTFVLDGNVPISTAPTASGQGAAGGKTTQDGVYTAEQAARGQTKYSQNCASCHGSDLSGSGQGPALAGDPFTQVWNGRTADELFGVTRSTMPMGNVGSLSPADYADIIAYMLKVNQFPAGSNELKSDPAALKAITITGRKN